MGFEPSRAVIRRAHLLLETAPATLAFPASSVLEVMRSADRSCDTVELSVLVPVHFLQSAPVSVVRVGSNAESILVLVSGTVHIEYYDDGALLNMPPLNVSGFGLYSCIATSDGKPSALVINIDALLRLHRELGR